MVFLNIYYLYMATFRKRRSRKYRNKNTRRKYHKARKSRSNRRSRKSLEGGVITDADLAWWDDEKQADKPVNEVMGALNMSMEDAIDVVKLMKQKLMKQGYKMEDAIDVVKLMEQGYTMDDAIDVVKLMKKKGYNMDVAKNILRSNGETKQLYKKLVESEKAKDAAEAKEHRIYRLFFGKPVKSGPTMRTQSGNDFEDRDLDFEDRDLK